MKVAAASTTIPVTNAAMQEIRQDFIENSGHCNPPCGFPHSRHHLKATPAPWRKGEFFELEPLNARKNGGYAATREANSGIRKKPAAAVARDTARLPKPPE
jgi:hypothetical protein